MQPTSPAAIVASMTSADLTPEQWAQLDRAVMRRWRDAFNLCQHIVDAYYPMDDPLYQYAGALLAATCDLRRLVNAGMLGEPLPNVDRKQSMMMYVKPHAGGGAVPH